MSAEVVPIKEDTKEPTYKASDIVTEVVIAFDLGAGKMSLRSHVRNLDGLPALRVELDKLTNASDWVAAKYRLRTLKLELEAAEKELVQYRTGRETYILKAQTEWDLGKRRGNLIFTESQKNIISRHDNNIEAKLQIIEKHKKDIAVTEAILKGSE